MIHPVVVVDSTIKPLTHTPRPCIGVPLRGVAVRGFFVTSTTTVPLTIVSTPDCGGEGGKRFSLTQGERLHEGSAPSDKRPCRLIVNRGNYGIVGSINKAAELYTGSSPIQDSPTRLRLGTPTNHHPYRSPCIV
jgi:hypothetical protein